MQNPICSSYLCIGFEKTGGCRWFMLIKCLSNTYQLYVKNLPQTRAKLQKSQSGMGTMSYLPNTKTIPRRILLRLCRSCFQKLRTQQLNTNLTMKNLLIMKTKLKSFRPRAGLIGKAGLTASIACGLTALAVSALALSSCNVTRKVTTQSEYVQRGDTSVVIMTKTIESYDASKKGL